MCNSNNKIMYEQENTIHNDQKNKSEYPHLFYSNVSVQVAIIAPAYYFTIK
jgi:hypothetical protein